MWPALACVTASAGSAPTVTSSITARSVTVRASGPPMSCVCDSGMMPSRLDSPIVPRRPNRLLLADGNPDRAAGVAAHAGRGEAGRDRGAGAAARSAGVARRIVRVARLTAERADRGDAGRELVQVGLADDDRACVAQLLHLKRVAAGHEAGQRQRSARGRQVDGFEVVLHDNRNPVERAAQAPRGALLVEGVGDLEHLRGSSRSSSSIAAPGGRRPGCARGRRAPANATSPRRTPAPPAARRSSFPARRTRRRPLPAPRQA